MDPFTPESVIQIQFRLIVTDGGVAKEDGCLRTEPIYLWKCAMPERLSIFSLVILTTVLYYPHFTD